MDLNERQINFIAMAVNATGYECEAEYKFHPERKWRFDFAFPVAMVAVEVEGGTWIGGRHTNPKGFEADTEKYNTAESMGWHVLRILPDRLCTKQTMDLINKTIQNS